MGSDDEEELAELRAARAARSGGEAATLSQLRHLQQRAEQARAAQVGPPRPPAAAAHTAAAAAAAAPRFGGGNDSSDDDDGDDGPTVAGAEEFVEEPDRMDDAVRAALPMAFGKQEVKVARADEVHAKTKRGAAAAAAPAIGPPRPPAVGPPRPPAAAASSGGGGGGGGGEDEDEDMVGPPRPPASGSGGDDGSSSGDDGGSDDESGGGGGDPYRLPVTHEVALSGATRAVTAVAVEHTGSRVAAGSLDNAVRLYDFAGMRADLRPFREVTPADGHPVHAVSWSPTGDAFLVVTGSAQAKIYDRDGREKGEFVRGDMYIRDARNTKGHVSGLTGGCWHPTDRYTALTGSEDGTVRVWDTWNVQQKTVIKPTLATPARVAVTAVAYNSDGRLIAAGLRDGTIQLWSVGGKFGRAAAVGAVQPPSAQHVEKQGWTYVSKPTQMARRAHAPESDVTGLVFSQDDAQLVSRGTDGTLKVWDVRALSKPLKAFSGLPAHHATTGVCLSPDERLILTGTAADEPRAGGSGGGGMLVFFDRQRLELVRALGMPGHVAAVAWHDRINQILVGVGDRASGATRVLYDPSLSERGALLPVARAPRAAHAGDFAVPLAVHVPGAGGPLRGGKRARDGADNTKAGRAKALKPDVGPIATERGRGGRLGTTSGTILTQHLLKQRGGLTAVDEEMDPREAILRHAGKRDEISLLTAAYAKTQPAPVFAEPSEDEEGDGEGEDGGG